MNLYKSTEDHKNKKNMEATVFVYIHALINLDERVNNNYSYHGNK